MLPTILRRNLIKRVFSSVVQAPKRTHSTETASQAKADKEGGEEKPMLTMAEVHGEIIKRMGLQRDFQLIPKSREHLLQYTPKLEDLPPRSMKDSFTTALVPLSQKGRLQDSYISFIGGVRVGRLMEDMDAFAVWVCHQHVKLPKLPAGVPLPYTFVTAFVDQVAFKHEHAYSVNKDIRLTGRINWVGRSSMEVEVSLEQLLGGKYRSITNSYFVMVARNATNTGAAVVNPLVATSEEEKKVIADAEQRKNMRKQLETRSLMRVEPNDAEQTLMYEIFRRTTDMSSMQLNRRILPPKCRWMSDWTINTIVRSFPQHRNAHNTIFGGYIMREAEECSWTCAYMYCMKRPNVLRLSDISFRRPVAISSFLKIHAYVIYTEKQCMVVMAVADIIDVVTGLQTTSNVFYSTYESAEDVVEVLPSTYHEMIWYIQGRRKFKQSPKV